ncbi:NTP transferase domain-containing protein [Patescibacteria group bacterium]|nr:NTP transferase domain-containing protein [Patescibacteria group bacterium]
MNKNKKSELLGAIVLAAGKGSRMKSKKINKVVLNLGDKPMIVHTINLLSELNFGAIVVVVGFAKKSVISVLGNKVYFAEQRKRLGTAHAVSCAMKVMPEHVENILVLNGDDSAFYKRSTIEKLLKEHFKNGSSFTLLTIKKDDPTGLGRVIRDKNNKVRAIVEEKDATAKERKIKEINPGCYFFTSEFLAKYLSKIKKSEVTGEYYLTSLINMGIKNNETIDAVKMGKIVWRGVNTKDELDEAEKLFFTLEK